MPGRGWIAVAGGASATAAPSALGSRAQHIPAAFAAGAATRCHRREKAFGPGRAVPLDRNAKACIAAYVRAWSARTASRANANAATRSPVPSWTCWRRCCRGLLPPYEAILIAAKAECTRSTVAEGLKGVGVGGGC